MLQASLVIPTAKLDISHLLQSSPSPPAPRTTQPPSFSRSASVSSTRPLYPLISSPSASTTSQVSAATAPAVSVSAQEPPARSAAPPQAPISVPLGSSSKRPPPLAPHPLATPAKKQSKWSQQENELIINLRGTGMKWEDISRNLPGRSAISCRLHYQNYLERKCEWDEEKKNKLARLYDRMKSDMWAGVARDLGVPWRTAEAMHWILGEQEMARRAGVTPFAMAGTSAIPPPDPSLAGGSNLSHNNQNTSPRGSDRSGPGLERSSLSSRENDARDREGVRRRSRGGGGTGSQGQGQGTQLPSLWELDVVGTTYEGPYEEEERGRRYMGSRED